MNRPPAVPDRLPAGREPAVSAEPAAPDGSFAGFVARARLAGDIVVQPRMGFGDPGQMRRGLLATRQARATTVGTITLDSFTRLRDYASAERAMNGGGQLNGYPIVSHEPEVTRAVLSGVRDRDFPVQVRHGSAYVHDIMEALVRVGLDATEGGPISYCLPYSRVPVRESIRDWARSCELFASLRERGVEPHLESFGGCMLGQLCPPSLLIALSILEGLFFRAHGLHSISLSYAQQANPLQDAEALGALRTLAGQYLPDLDWHIVLYTYMGVYPASRQGALALLRDSARLAVEGGAHRLIVKTAAEASRIPTIAENIEALEIAGAAVAAAGDRDRRAGHARPALPDTGILAETRAIVEAVLELSPRLDTALLRGVERGYIDVPFCLHPDNRGQARSYLDADGRIGWSRAGAMPLRTGARATASQELTSSDLIQALNFVRDRYDKAPAAALAEAGTDAAVEAEL